MTIIALTGHRPEDCEYEPTVRRKARQVYEDFPKIDTVVCGMAAGWDLWAGEEAINRGLEVWAAIPWKGHGPRVADEELYERILANATRVEWVDDSLTYPGPWVYHKRNEWMVDNADRVLAYWSGKKSGGTYACIKYAEKVGKKVRNCYGDF